MKIDKVAGSAITQTQFDHSSRRTSTTASSQPRPKPGVQVDTQRMANMQEQLKQLPSIDMDKVAAVKDALARGELELDIQALSGAIMQFHTGHE